MTGRFMIRHKDGREFGLEGSTGLKVFREVYEPEGFTIPKDQPHGWVAPDTKTKDAPKAAKPAAEGSDGGDKG
jgi:hypothetical protein